MLDLSRHFAELRSGRGDALDVAFTRFMTQQHFMFRPGLRIIDQQLHEAGDIPASSPVPGSPASSAHHGSLISPRARERFGSLAGLMGEDGGGGGLLHGNRRPSGFGHVRKGSTRLEEDIVRASRRINRKSYLAQTHLYHAERQAQARNDAILAAKGFVPSVTSPTGADAPDIHPSLRSNAGAAGGRRVLFSAQTLPVPSRRTGGGSKDDAAILDACRQLEAEMAQRRSTEAANEALRKQVEALTAAAAAAAAGHSPSSPSHDDSDASSRTKKLLEELESLKLKLALREESLKEQDEATALKKKELEEAEARKAADERPPTPSPNAPPAPPMAPPPPPPPGPPGPPGAPGGLFSMTRRIVSAREKEKEESARWGLPLLPAIEPTVLCPTPALAAAAAADPSQRVVLKKLHWVPLAAEDFMVPTTAATTPSAKAQGSASPINTSSTNVWKDLFTRAQERGTQEAVVTVQRNKLIADGSSTPEANGSASLSELAVPLVPQPSTVSDNNSAAPDASNGNSNGSNFNWRWEVDPRRFAQLFAQKAAGQMKRKPAASALKKVNKYSLGRAGAKELAERMAAAKAAGKELDEFEQGDDDDDEEEEGGEEDTVDGSEDGSGVPRRRKKASSTSADLSSSSPRPRVELVDAKRSYNVSISLTHFRGLTPLLIRDALLQLDGARLGGLDALEVLEDLVPTGEEVALVRQWLDGPGGGDPRPLGPVEQFFLALGVPGVRERLRLLVFVESFGSVARRVEDSLEIVGRALRAVEQARDAIAIVLAIILRIGNLMNASAMTWQPANGGPAPPTRVGLKALPPSASTSNKGSGTSAPLATPVQSVKQCYGFYLPATLSKLRSVKALPTVPVTPATSISTALVPLSSPSNDVAAGSPSPSPDDEWMSVGPSTGTLLHFLVRYVSSRVSCRPTIGAVFAALLPRVREAARVEQAFLLAEIKQLGQNLALTKQLIDEDDRIMPAAAAKQSSGNGSSSSDMASPSPSPQASSAHSNVSIGVSSAVTDPPTPSAPSPLSSPSPSLASTPPYTPLPPRVREFYSYASTRLEAMQAQLTAVRELHQSLQAYYLLGAAPSSASSSSSSGGASVTLGGVGPSDPNAWESFAALWADFFADWMQAEEECEDERAAEAKKLRQAEAARALKAKRDEAARLKVAQGSNAAGSTAGRVPSALTVDAPSVSSTSSVDGPLPPLLAAHHLHVTSLSSRSVLVSTSASPPVTNNGSSSTPAPSLAQSLLSFLTPASNAALRAEQEERVRLAASAAQLAAHAQSTSGGGDFSSMGSVSRPDTP
jgi:hypothetical protein